MDLLDELITEDIIQDNARVLCENIEEHADIDFESKVCIEVPNRNVMKKFIRDINYILETSRCIEAFEVYVSEEKHYVLNRPNVCVDFVYRKTSFKSAMEFMHSICQYVSRYETVSSSINICFIRNTPGYCYNELIDYLMILKFARRDIDNGCSWDDKVNSIACMFEYELSIFKVCEKTFLFKFAHDLARSRDTKSNLYKASIKLSFEEVTNNCYEDNDMYVFEMYRPYVEKELTVYGETFELMARRYFLLTRVLGTYQKAYKQYKSGSIFSSKYKLSVKHFTSRYFIETYLQRFCSKNTNDMIFSQEQFKMYCHEVSVATGPIKTVYDLDWMVSYINNLTFHPIPVDKDFVEKFRLDVIQDN